MIGQYFNIPKYDWEVKVYYGVTKHDIPFCLKKLRKLNTQKNVKKLLIQIKKIELIFILHIDLKKQLYL